jgi:hypothetical protein
MRKPVQEAALLDMLHMEDHIAVTATARSCNDVLVEWEWDEDNEHE